MLSGDAVESKHLDRFVRAVQQSGRDASTPLRRRLMRGMLSMTD